MACGGIVLDWGSLFEKCGVFQGENLICRFLLIMGIRFAP